MEFINWGRSNALSWVSKSVRDDRIQTNGKTLDASLTGDDAERFSCPFPDSFLRTERRGGRRCFAGSRGRRAYSRAWHRWRAGTGQAASHCDGAARCRAAVRRALASAEKLFLEGTEAEKAAQMLRIEDGQSIMDLVREQTADVGRKLGREDNQTRTMPGL